ncbi:hypothetical protein PRIPAC_81730 [Pristionchus pacificus]|uniref:Uncharacterized protein n=1 Tax=Pristionchus pacificus TaxID=54126 RepID=A0A454XQA1_PRIPA|nr:hypothetical protein PRIPAC_81730 [Pristionchus pacificus]|eukprot:PDM78847.1 hypothetical protein PRIPAC_31426 [Pristionchus pacificus]
MSSGANDVTSKTTKMDMPTVISTLENPKSQIALVMYRHAKDEEKKIAWTSNPRDTALLHRTWTEDFETLYTIGSNIFHKLFAGPNGAACKSLYPWIAKYEESGRDYVETNDFRVLCLRLVQTVAIFLDEIGEKAKVEVFLYKLGQRHVDYLPRDTKEEFLDMLRDATHEGFNERVHSLSELTEEERDRAIQLWTDSVDYIFNMVKEGFFDGLKSFDRFPGIEKWALVQYLVPSPEYHPTIPENHF